MQHGCLPELQAFCRSTAPDRDRGLRREPEQRRIELHAATTMRTSILNLTAISGVGQRAKHDRQMHPTRTGKPERLQRLWSGDSTRSAAVSSAVHRCVIAVAARRFSADKRPVRKRGTQKSVGRRRARNAADRLSIRRIDVGATSSGERRSHCGRRTEQPHVRFTDEPMTTREGYARL